MPRRHLPGDHRNRHARLPEWARPRTLRHATVAAHRHHRLGMAHPAHAEPAAGRDFPIHAVSTRTAGGFGACHVGGHLSTGLSEAATLGTRHQSGLSKTITLDT